MLPHTYGEAVVSQEPNCTQPGQLSATCTSCGQTHVVGQVPVNDVHDMENTQLRAPTCTDAGEGVNTCKRCGLQESCSYPATGHSLEVTYESEGNCRSKSQKLECRNCSLLIIQNVPYNGEHSYAQNPFNPWDKEYRCVICGEERPKKISTGKSIEDNIENDHPDTTPPTLVP